MRNIWGFVSGAAIACAVASCTYSPAAKPPPPATPTLEVDADERSLELVKKLAANDIDGAYELLNARMRRAMSKAELAAVWHQMADSVGDKAELHIDERHEKEDNAVRILQLDGEGGSVRPQVAVDLRDGFISGLYFLPPKRRAGASSTRSAELSVGSAPLALGATLTLPDGEGPHPAVVLVAGSGPQDRDETFGPNKPFRDLAEQLANKGIAALRYDKRTRAHPKAMDPASTTVEEEVIADAVQAVDLVAARPEVKPDCVVLVGHSLGGLLAPEIATRSKYVAATVLLAVSGRPLSQVVVEQMRLIAQVPPEQLQEIAQQSIQLRAGKLAPTDTFLSVPVRYWTDLDGRDEIAIARKSGKPLLYLRGARDYQVTDADQDAWQRGLSGVKTASFETLPDLNHFFIRGEGPPGPAEYGRPGTVAPVVAERIARFVAETCPKK